MKPLDVIKKYYPESPGAYRILVTHNRSMADRALALTRLHTEMNLGLTFIKEATVSHNIGIFLCNAPSIDCHGEIDYICHGYLGADLIRKEGYPRHTLVCEGHTETGFLSAMIEERNLPVPHRDARPVPLEEQSICFADKFSSKTKSTEEKPVDKIKQSLPKYGGETVERLEHWCKLSLEE